MNSQFYNTLHSSFDSFTIVWKEIDTKTQIIRIFLSDPELNSEVKALKANDLIKKKSSPSIELVGEQIQKFLEGEDVKFDLQLIDFDQCSKVQKKVLLAEYGIPRGYISTYKRIANEIGITNGARAVGNALANNPFPIIIPCHRAIKSNGELGGFQGGIEMKRALLEMEGIIFSSNGKVITDRIYY